MKEKVVKIILVVILILYSCMDEFFIVLPFIILLFFAFIVEIKTIKIANLSGNKYVKNMFWLIIISTITLFWTPNREDSLFQIMVLLVLLLVGFLYYYYIKKYQGMDLVLYTLLAVSYVNHIGALRIPIFNRLMYTTSEKGGVVNGWGWGERFSGITENPNSLSVLLLFSVFLSLFALNKKQSIFKLTKSTKIICIVNVLLSVYSIFMTQSRKGMVLGVLLVFFYVIVNLSIKKVFPYLVAIISLLFLSALLPELESDFESGFNRIEGMTNLFSNEGKVDNSSMIRLTLVEYGWQMFIKKPITGYGIGSFRQYFILYSHNNFIELVFGVGLVGLFIYYNIYRFILNKLFKNWRQNVFIIYFVFTLLIMDLGYVSYENKMNMLILIVVLLIVDEYSKNNRILSKTN